ncbi:tRNA-splicing endonuclease subunit Sen34 [Mycena indigotica]|uniref:tRNA-splicing endonuclease subunit Sen34 n=1 Tax=Mycena indigotica TaxID=2126181 RepID=A0A8H6S913_9AGAR|nr:tRNA-splicing endonuclease subunit Sen34 [Mycena indigotica]KAF7295063.1 tRNA-splicing endonuclease subunit Sen34 [Mycena indigotica]
MTSPRIPLRIANQKAYVWNVEDIANLRSNHRICGLFTGTLPHLSQQNVFLGVPMVLLPEEVVLLVENDAVVLVDDPKAHIQPSLDQLKHWASEDKQSALLQITQAASASKDAPPLSEEAARKRKEREAKKAAKARQAASNDIMAPEQEEPPPSSQLDGLYTVLIPATTSSHEWYNDSACGYTTLAEAKAAGIWSYPSDLHERAKCGVFRGLWEQGMYIGIGIKFGGDYLVYPGDPLRYHAHFSASVLMSPTAQLTPMEIVAHGRLGTVTKKAHLLCGWDDAKKEVSYLTIEWAGFG